MKYLLIIFSIAILVSCQNETQTPWKHLRTIELDSIAPNGIIANEYRIVISDPAKNSLFHLNSLSGHSIDSISQQKGFQRLMHISEYNQETYIPEFLSDSIKISGKDGLRTLNLPEQPDAPSAVSVMDGAIAVADFYNNRIIYSRNGENKTFGQEGMLAGDLNYPTDVQFAHNKIYVADAYNHRINVYDLDGAFQFSFGKEEKMNAAVGIYVSDMHAFVCDYENSKVNIYDLNGKFQTSIDKDLSKPSDTYFHNDKLYVANFEGKSISVFSMK